MVNAVTGSGSLNVPITTTPGRSGFGPKLSLSYDSGFGNGPFGFGWSLALPAITRKSDKGLPRYFDDDESDVFVLSGAEDLVPILNETGRISFSRTVHGVKYEIRLYRPRLEGLFARIERWTRIDNRISHWRTISRDNVTTIFGFEANSRIFDPRDQRHVFSYLISLTFDDKGNAAQYEYADENSVGIDKPAAHEANRTDDLRRVQRYPKYIRYGNVTSYHPNWSPSDAPEPVPTDWHFQVVFDYGDHPSNTLKPARDAESNFDWEIRPDPFSTYRSGFEVRTYRRCKRILLFHQFAGEPDFVNPTLVKSTDFVYSDEIDHTNNPTEADAAASRNPIFTFLESITQSGYRTTTNGYDRRSTPPLEFSYTQPQIHPEILTLVDADSHENLPEGLDGSRYRWVDLDGEGLPGILTEQNGAWGYKRNLSPINRVNLPNQKRVPRARFGPMERIPSLPAAATLSAGQQLLDLTGSGRPQLTAFDATVPGYFARTAEEDWAPLKAFNSLPQIRWSDPNLKFVDLTGDGRADILIAEEGLYTFYPSLGLDGFGAAEHVRTAWDEKRGPRVVFADERETISLADMSGDGLSDIVRVRNGEVCYWPNLGYANFGPKVTMDNAPRFTDGERFDPGRVRFADIDGSGTTDLLYVADEGVRVCFNRSGNSWADPYLLAVFPGSGGATSVQVIDLLGTGTACLVWSSPEPGETYAPLRYVDLMGSKKPHLLDRMRNNLGAETRLAYAPSTQFYLQDKRAGKPGITRLPFPVHVLERMETYDWIGRSRFVTRYAYHHGYFDGEEREFRGFGMVEQWDTEIHLDDSLFPEADPTNEAAESLVPPVLTRTWFHTGAFVEADNISRQYANEYWIEPALRGTSTNAVKAQAAMLLPDSVIENILDLEPDEIREAYRALKGSPLRIEIYSEDGTPRAEHPYRVTEQNFAVRRVQPRGRNRHAVFLSHARESFSYHYERQAKDSRIAHAITLKVSPFGEVERSVNVAYGRQPGYAEPEPELSTTFREMLRQDQRRLHVIATEQVFTKPVNQPPDKSSFDSYRAPLPCETITAELAGITPRADRFVFEEMGAHWTTLWTGKSDLPYEQVSTSEFVGADPDPQARSTRRIVEHKRTLYRSNNLISLLPLGVTEARALPGESYRLALTTSLVNRVFDASVDQTVLGDGGYYQWPGENDWWIPSGLVFYSLSNDPVKELDEANRQFYRIRRFVDPLGGVSQITYDNYDLLPVKSEDPVHNITTARNDYRVLQPCEVIDPNLNSTEVAFDCLGYVVGTAVRGKFGEGDSLANFDSDLSKTKVAAALRALEHQQIDDPEKLLGSATSRVVYDQFAYFNTRDKPSPQPPLVYTLTRDTHVAEGGGKTRNQHAFLYSDGFGREAQKKIFAGPEPGGGVKTPRWIGSGWTIYNNKGKPVRKYEPFFSSTFRFEFDRRAGVSSVLFYDPVERLVATLHPDNTFEKSVFDAWRQETWDRNDTALISDPRRDANVGDFFARLLGNDAFQSWHDARITGNLGADADEQTANRDAAQKVALQQTVGGRKGTPTVAHFDSLGRTCLSVSDNGVENGKSQRFATRTAFDIEGKPLAIFDAQERRVMEYCRRESMGGEKFQYVAGYDVAGQEIYRKGMDGGERRMLNNVAGKPFCAWNDRRFAFTMRYDLAHRLTHRYVERADIGKLLLERLIYGEDHTDSTRNLKGKLFRHYDSGGLAVSERYDFKGNVVESARQFANLLPAAQPADFYQTAPNWSAIENVTDVASLDQLTTALLATDDRFVTFSRFDALNRPIQVVTPHRAAAPANQPSVIQPTYDESNLLAGIDVWTRQNNPPGRLLDAQRADIHAVTHIDYNARGQRQKIKFGNGVWTEYEYDHETFRLIKLTAQRPDTFTEDERIVQELSYQYDPVGNITSLRDAAGIQSPVYFNNHRVETAADYKYDALYRLTAATGREHLGQNGGVLTSPDQITNDDRRRTHSGTNTRLLNPNDAKAMGKYTEEYAYDSVGNLLHMIHNVATGGWTRHYSYAEPSRIDPANETSNRLSATSLPGDDPKGPYHAVYTYDEHGNMTRMPHLQGANLNVPGMTWDADDRLQSTTRQQLNQGMPEVTYYVYDASGERLRKVTYHDANPNTTPVIKSERLYIGGFEIYREYNGGSVDVERETLHIMDDKQRVAIVETRTLGADQGLEKLTRYQYSNHLGSAALELDENAAVISYEEYFPYGGTAHQAVRNQTDTPKRYRYTGKERDEENDLYYHGARYYAPWLGRWTACDPAGLVDGNNLYVYVSGKAVNRVDPDGRKPAPPQVTPEPRLEFMPNKQHMEAARRKIVSWARAEEKPTSELQRFFPANPTNEEHNARVTFVINYMLIEATNEMNPRKSTSAGEVIDKALSILTAQFRNDKDVKGASESLIYRDAQRYLYGRSPRYAERVFSYVEDPLHKATGKHVPPGPTKEFIKNHPVLSTRIYEAEKRGVIGLNALLEIRTGVNPGFGRSRKENPHSRPGGEHWFQLGLQHADMDQSRKRGAPFLLFAVFPFHQLNIN